MNDRTTISLRKQTKKVLDEIGKKGESYDDIVLKSANHYKWFMSKE